MTDHRTLATVYANAWTYTGIKTGTNTGTKTGEIGRIIRSFLVVLPLALAGCSGNSSPLLAPPPANLQTGQLPPKQGAQSVAEQAQLKAALKNCPTTAEPTKTIGVAAMIEQAKTTPDAPKAGQMSKADSDCLAARVKAQLIASSGQSAPASAGSNATAGPSFPSKGGDLTIDFDSETAPVSPKDKRAIAEMLAKKGSSTGRIKIFAGRGGNGNMFDQAVVAQKRANRVKELLPPSVVVSVEFDPQQIDDTVRIEFLDKT
jgi:hypothetical protein